MNFQQNFNDSPYTSRPSWEADLRQQIIDLHQMTQQRAAAASPLGRQLLEMARNGTYERLAPLIAAADPQWQPERPIDDGQHCAVGDIAADEGIPVSSDPPEAPRSISKLSIIKSKLRIRNKR